MRECDVLAVCFVYARVNSSLIEVSQVCLSVRGKIKKKYEVLKTAINKNLG